MRRGKCRTHQSVRHPPNSRDVSKSVSFPHQGVLLFDQHLRTVSNLRMQAVMMTLKGLWAASRRLEKVRIKGLQRPGRESVAI